MRIHFVANVHRKDAMNAAMDASKWMVQKGAIVAVERETARFVNLPVVSDEEFGGADLVVAFGGDGTLIRAAHLCLNHGTPILGVYYGRFGFVTQCSGKRLSSCVEEFLAGHGKVEERMMLEASLLRNGQPVASIHALNETVLQRTIDARMMTFQVIVDGISLTRYPADGVLVCTPTGSTAYNLSAGGPIVDPTVEALILSAIAPHTLAARSLVLRPDSEVHIQVQTVGGVSILSADAQIRLHLLEGDSVFIRKSPRRTHLVIVDQDDFLLKLNQRLFWSQRLGDDQ